MKSKRIIHNWILFFVLSINFFVTGFVIGGNIFNTEQNNLESSNNVNLNEKGEIASISYEDKSSSKSSDNIYSSVLTNNDHQIKISDGESNSINKRSSQNFLILNEGQPWSSSTSGYKYRKAIRIESGGISGISSLTNFPLFIELFDEDLHDYTRSDGNDIVFTDYSGNKLDHEIELFDQNYSSTQAHLVTWVRFPSLPATTDSTIFMYFNKPSQSSAEENPTNVWIDYESVHHMNEDPSASAPQITDVTGNGWDGAAQTIMSLSDLQSGKLGKSINFVAGNNTAFFIGNIPSDSWSEITVSAWVNSDVLGDDRIVSKEEGTGVGPHIWKLGVDTDDVQIRIDTEGGGFTERQVCNCISISTWYYITLTWDASLSSNEFKAYVNGEVKGQISNSGTTITDSSQLVAIGNNGNRTRAFDGQIDEVRIINNARSPDWLLTEFNNQNDPTSFYSVGPKHSQISWPQVDFSFRKNITISSSVVSGSSNLNDFPYLLELTDEDLKYKTLASGYDILFTDQDGVPYDHEIEIFDQSVGYLKTWIRIPTFSATTDTKLVMYYGNQNAITSYENVEAVWDNNYVAVWHMNNDPSGPSPQILDSTGNSWDGSYAFNTFTADDLVNGTIYFDDSNDGFNVGNIDSNSWDQLTLQGWINPFNSEYDKILTKENTTGSGGPYSWYLGRNSGNIYYRITRDGGSSYSMNVAAGIQNNEWNSLAFTWDGTITSNHMVGYKDGSIVNTRSTGSSTYTIYSTPYDVYLGITGYSGNDVGGYLDEIRISNIVRSPDWLATEYNNQIDPTSYITTQSEEKFIDIFDYRKQITIDHNQVAGSSELLDLPLYFDFYDSDVRTKAQANGNEIYFADNNGTKLSHEFLEYSDNGSHIHVRAWVRVNRIQPSTNTIIYMFYGNNEIESQEADYGAGQGAYRAIYHLDETASNGGTTTIHKDSASGYDGNQNGNNNVTGIIGEAQYFDGSTDQIVINSTTGLDINGDLSISGWFKLDSNFNEQNSNSLVLLTKFLNPLDDNFHITLKGTDYSAITANNGSLLVKLERAGPTAHFYTSRTSWTAGTWYHFIVNIDSATPSNSKIYINGVDDTGGYQEQTPGSAQNLGFSADIGFGGGTIDQFDINGTSVGVDHFFTGLLDEFRISSKQRTADWILNEYNSILNPNVMFTISREEQNFPYLQNFGVYDPGNGFPQYWANITGGWQGTINTATIEIDSTPVSMSHNGTHWVYAPAGVVFNTTYSYQIVNATNTLGQYLRTTSTLESYTSNKDVIDPTIDGTPQYEGSNINDGIFSVNVSDSWGSIDTVLVTILDHSDDATCGGSCYNPAIAVMQNNSIEFVNNSISLFKGTVTYQIVVNDTVGNIFVSGNQTANVLNKIPSTSNITLTPTDIASNGTLTLNYDYFDPENTVNASIDVDSGTEIRWYLNGSHQSAYDDNPNIGSSALFRYDRWNISVRPKDGILFGNLQWYSGSQIVVGNSAPEASSLVITPASPMNTSDLTADWTFFDEDGDAQPVDSWIIRWNNNITGLQSAYNDLKTVPAVATTKDQEWWFTLYVYDGFEYSIEYTSPVKRIVNSAPVASNVAIEGTPKTTSLLNATWDYSDADFDSQISYLIRWYMNNGSGFVYQNQFDDNISINPSFTEKGQVWNFTLEVFDGTSYSVLYTSPTKTIINSAPTANTLTITTDPVTTVDLVANWTYVDVDNDAQSIAWRIRWYRDGSLVSNFNDLLAVPAGYTNKSEVWNFTVQVFDGTEYSILYSSGSTTIQNTAPVVTSVSLTPFSPNATSSQDLQVSWTYYDVDADPENISAVQILWYRNGIIAPSFNDSTTISYENTTRADEWYFVLWAYDGESYSSFNTSNTVTILNSLPIFQDQPSFNNTSPGENEDFNITLSSYYDEDGDSIQNMTVFWFVDGFENQTLFNRTVIFQSETEIGQFWFYIIDVYDGLGWSGNVTSRTIGIGQPENFAPYADNLNLTILTFFPLTTDDLTATYDYSDRDNDPNPHPEFGTFIYWYLDNGTGFVLQSQFNGSFTISSSFTSEGDLWLFTIVPKDVFIEPAGGWQAFNSTVITISNSAPDIIDYGITVNPNNNTDLIATYTSFDADIADTLTIEILWYQNGFLRPDLNNSETIYANLTFKGDKWNYSIRVLDEAVSSIWYNSSITTILNTAPEISSAVLVLPAAPLTTENLSASYTYFDLDGDTPASPEIFWYRNGKLEPLLNNSLTVSSSFTKKNENWYYTIQVNDSDSWSILYFSSTIQIINSEPLATDLSFNPSSPKRDDPLTIIYTWSDPDQNANDIESGTRIRWYRNDILVPSLNDALIVPGELIIKGDNWNVTVEPSDGTTFGTIVFINVTVSNTAPVITSATIIPGSTTFTTSDLIASYTMTDVDGDSLTIASILWYNNSQLVAALTGNFTVPSGLTTKHGVWYYELQVFDGTDLSFVYSSSNITILNSLPTITSITLNPVSPRTTNNLQANWTYVDADNDPAMTPLIRWYKINILQPSLNDSNTIDSSLTTKNELWFFRIQVFDGENYSVLFESSTVQILNSLPVVSEWQFTSSLTPTTLDDLVIGFNFTDADPADIFLSARIRWYRDSELQALYNDQPTVPASSTTHFESWNVSIQPFDGQSFGDAVYLNVTVINSKPTINTIILSPTQNAFTTSQLSISYTPADFDNDPIQAYNITWFVGPNPGTLVAQPSYANLSTIFANQTLKGQWWGVEVMVFDGTDWSDSSTRQLKEIKNSLPIASNIVLTPSGSIFSNQTITLTWAYSDADNDLELIPYIIWYRNALKVSALENSSIVPISETSKNENWYAVLQVYDGFNLSQSYVIPVFTILNSIPTLDSAVINGGASTTDVSTDLILSYNSFDADTVDFDQNRIIYWYRNGIYRSEFDGNFTIP
ncbi:MAG: DUF2341 domain-containing protein, partial [Candidatus Kariarchaeaceae archaeon]